MLVVLHNIRSSYNVGSIFRTADAAGIEKIYCCGITPRPFDRFARPNQRLAKTALGAQDYILWEYARSTTKLLDRLKKQRYQIFAAEQAPNSVFLFGVKLKKSQLNKIALVLGNEIRGLSRAILKRADKIVEIPMRGKKESLNVAVAFGVVAFYLVSTAS